MSATPFSKTFHINTPVGIQLFLFAIGGLKIMYCFIHIIVNIIHVISFSVSYNSQVKISFCRDLIKGTRIQPYCPHNWINHWCTPLKMLKKMIAFISPTHTK